MEHLHYDSPQVVEIKGCVYTHTPVMSPGVEYSSHVNIMPEWNKWQSQDDVLMDPVSGAPDLVLPLP